MTTILRFMLRAKQWELDSSNHLKGENLYQGVTHWPNLKMLYLFCFLNLGLPNILLTWFNFFSTFVRLNRLVIYYWALESHYIRKKERKRKSLLASDDSDAKVLCLPCNLQPGACYATVDTVTSLSASFWVRMNMKVNLRSIVKFT